VEYTLFYRQRGANKWTPVRSQVSVSPHNVGPNLGRLQAHSTGPSLAVVLPMRHSILTLALLVFACNGSILSSKSKAGVPGSTNAGPNGEPTNPGQPPGNQPSGPTTFAPSAALAPTSGARRLTVREYDNLLNDLLGDSSRPSAAAIPEDPRAPFDNAYAKQVASQALIEGLNKISWDAVDRLLTDVPRRDKVVGCKPAAVGTDAVCFRSFIERFGRLAFRRPLTPAEVSSFESKFAPLGTEANDFYQGVRPALAAFLQHGNTVYRLERGTPSASGPNVLALNDFEMASRMSFLLWGSGPDDALLNAAQRGELITETGVRTMAASMLADPRAKKMMAVFHAQWIGYEHMTGPLAPAMQTETAALLERVIFTEHRPWREIFTFNETFVGDELAKNYGLPLPGQAAPKWVSLANTKRLGIFSQGSFLNLESTEGNDTSPTRRGKAVYTKLLCGKLGGPPANAPKVATGPSPNDCKDVRYVAHSKDPGCAGCHISMDPIGFGLENYDRFGAFRATEPGKPTCSISGTGKVAGVGNFNGPGELGTLLANSGNLEPCLAKQMYRFAYGRSDAEGALTAQDEEAISSLASHMTEKPSGAVLDAILIDFVSSAPFRHRKEEI
jgi:Protein of unknown function (DUF1592)/Protein of unknown function (DUF1588)/Protein of unknown function (DUF1595)/Protein of unknown function (DUF1587)/Protein of unknown function (DUF1585)